MILSQRNACDQDMYGFLVEFIVLLEFGAICQIIHPAIATYMALPATVLCKHSRMMHAETIPLSYMHEHNIM